MKKPAKSTIEVQETARCDITNAEALQGEQLFASAGCVKCHTPTLATCAFHPMAELRNQTFIPTPISSCTTWDQALRTTWANGATGSEWRSPPLWSIGLTTGVSGGEPYLHDCRAAILEEAILWHGGEGEQSKEAFRTMSASSRTALIKLLKSL